MKRFDRNALGTFIAAALAASTAPSKAGPQDGNVVAGAATISQAGTETTITQTTQRAAIDWLSFDIGSGESVRFVQPDSSAVALNRVLGSDPSSILGNLSANGHVFLINPNGILFGADARVNVGALVASTRAIAVDDFMAGRLRFGGDGAASIRNFGTIDARGGSVALLGAVVSNEGTITARLGSIALAAGDAFTLDVAGDGLLNVAVDAGAVGALAENGGLLAADGGRVLLTARSAGDLLPSLVANTGIVRAQTVEQHAGVVRLLGDLRDGTAHVGGTLDASAPAGGSGGFVDTSAARVRIADDAVVTTFAPGGGSGLWLIDPPDFTVAASGGDMTGAQLSTSLGLGNVLIQSSAGAAGVDGDIHVHDNVSWSANLLTLEAHRNIDITATMNGTGSADLALVYGLGAPAVGNSAYVSMLAPVNLPGGNHFSTRLGSDGVTANYTVINDMAGLQAINSGLTANYALGSNLDATGVTFTPIGPMTFYNDFGNMFSGQFDGLGHTISNLTVNRNAHYNGLFGGVSSSGWVRNVGVVDVSITGFYENGGIIGFNYGLLGNSYTSGSVTGLDDVGGLVGYNSAGALIVRSHSSATISHRAGALFDAHAGGLVGYNYVGSIVDSYATGSVSGKNVGGLSGVNNGGLIASSLAMGPVTGQFAVGGLVAHEYNGGVASNSYWNVTTTGQSGSIEGTGLTTAELQAAMPAGFSNGAWGNAGNQSTPYLLSSPGRALIVSDGGANYYDMIVTLEQLQNVGLVGHYALGNHIDASATSGWNGGAGFAPIADGSVESFDAMFDGLDFEIRGLFIDRPATDHVGLFGLTFGAQIQNLHLVDADVTGRNLVGAVSGTTVLGHLSNVSVTGVVHGGDSVGGLVGYDNTTLVVGSYSTADVFGGSNVGGLLGETNGGTEVNSSFATGNVTATGDHVGGIVGRDGFAFNIQHSYATGSVTGDEYVGGIMGSNFNGVIAYSYSTGAVTGTTAVGGLLGFNDSGTVIDSYWDTQLSGQATSAGGTGLTTAQMRQDASYSAGWDIGYWRNYEGFTAPLLVRFMTPLTVTPGDITRTYDGLAYAGTPTLTYSATPDVSLLLGTPMYSLSGTNVGTTSIGVTGLYSSQFGYDITFANGTQTIDPFVVSLTGGRTYDGTANVSAGSLALGTLANGETLSLTGTGSTNGNAGTGHALTLDSLALVDGTGLASNYTLTGGTHTVDIARAALTLGTTNVVRAYDGGLTASGTLTVVGGTLFGSDSVSGGTFAFTDKNAGAGNKTVTVSGAVVSDGNTGGNYTVTYSNNTTSTITPRTLTASAGASDKTYDGSTTASATLTGLTGLVGTETVGATATSATFNTRNVATANLVTVNGVTLSDGTNGGLASNYSLASGQTAVAHITPRTLTASANASDKVYDGSTTASATLSGLTGLVGTETVGATATSASFNSRNVAAANLVTVNGITLSDGTNGGLASNYSLAGGQTATAHITPRTLTMSGTVAGDKFFDGTTIATLSGSTLTGVVPGDAVTFTSTGAFTSPAIGFDVPVTVTSTLQGAASGNYLLTPLANLLVADILAPRPLATAYGYTATIATRLDASETTRLWSYEPEPVPLKVADEPTAAGH